MEQLAELVCEICGSTKSVDASFDCPLGDPCCATAVCNAHEELREQIHMQRGCSPALVVEAEQPSEVLPVFRQPVSDSYADYLYSGGTVKGSIIVGEFVKDRHVLVCETELSIYLQLANDIGDQKTFGDFARFKTPTIVGEKQR